MIRDFLRYFRPIRMRPPVFHLNRSSGPDARLIRRQYVHMILVQDID